MYITIKARPLLAGAAVLAALVFGFFSFGSLNAALPASASIDNWGLSFPKQGGAPTGNATADFLKNYNAAYMGNTEKPVIYFTFDAGYENGYTAKILDTLDQNKVPATFFLVGGYLERNGDLVKQMLEQGHTIGNHTMNHPDLEKISTKQAFEQELLQFEEKYRLVTGQEPTKLYRPPQGKYSKQNLQMAKDLGYNTAFWSLAYVDWFDNKQPTRPEALEKLLPRAHNGCILLLHSTSKTNADILHELIGEYRRAGFEFGRLEDIFA